MKKFTILLSLLLLLPYINAIAMECPIAYQQATKDHISSILNLINNHAINDNDKIVILPEKFRQSAIEDNILNKKLYCAIHNNTVVGFKKLYTITSEDEFNDVVHNEIRCLGDKSSLIQTTVFSSDNTKSNLHINANFPWSLHNSIVIYTGGDFTQKAHRGQGINSFLMNCALTSITDAIKNTIATNNKINYIVMLYGLTKSNAGENGGIDRTPSIVRALRKSVEEIFPNNKSNIIHKSYEAYMPTFNPKNDQCIPNPDKKSIPGYGNVLIFPLNNNTIIQ
jgi:hypothetical protein